MGAMYLLCRQSLQHVTPPHVTSCDHMIKQSCDFAVLTISHHSARFDGYTLYESVNVANHENYNELLYVDLTLPCDQREV